MHSSLNRQVLGLLLSAMLLLCGSCAHPPLKNTQSTANPYENQSETTEARNADDTAQINTEAVDTPHESAVNQDSSAEAVAPSTDTDAVPQNTSTDEKPKSAGNTESVTPQPTPSTEKVESGTNDQSTAKENNSQSKPITLSSQSEDDESDDGQVDMLKRLKSIPQPPPSYHPYLAADKIASKPDASQLISLNFNNEPVASVMKALFADTLKLNYILDKSVQGNITVVTTTPFPKRDLFDVILLILKLNGLTVTKAGDYYLIVPTNDAMKYMLPTTAGMDASKIKPSERIITQVVPLKFLSPTDISAIITELKSPETHLITLDAANILIFTGPASNIRRMMEMIQVLDVETSQEEFRVFQIKYADAQDIMSTLQSLFQRKVSGGSVPGGSNRRRAASPPRGQRGKRRGNTAAATGSSIISVGGTSGQPVMLVDTRSNSLMVFGTKKDMEFIEKIIGILDVDIYTYQEIFIYYVENAKAKDLKTILEELYKGTTQTTGRKSRTTSQRRTKIIEKERPGQIVGEVKMSVDERTNALIIQTTQRNYRILESMIKKLDVIPKQVLVEVLIAEITLDDSQQLGIQWNLKSSGTLNNSSFSSTTNTNFNVAEGTGLNWTIFEPSRFQSFLNTFATTNRLEVLSNPHIMCSNNQEAKIQVGDEVPTITSSTTNTSSTSNTGTNVTNTVEYRNTGIILTVNARVNERRMVSMDISQEVSEAQENQLADVNSPIIRKRTLKTSIVVRDNQTLVMGGLMQKKKDFAHQGIPLLSKIPVLRWLFGTESRTNRKTELIVFITPHVIGSPMENFDKTNELLNKLPRLKGEIDKFNSR